MGYVSSFATPAESGLPDPLSACLLAPISLASVSPPTTRTRASRSLASPRLQKQAKKQASVLKGQGPCATALQTEVLTAVGAAVEFDLGTPQDMHQHYERCPFHLVCENPSEDAPAVLAEMLTREPEGVTALDVHQRLPLHVAGLHACVFA